MMKLQAVLSGFILTFCLCYSVYVSFIITGDFFGELRLFSIYKRGLETRIDCFRVCEVSTSMNQIQIDKSNSQNSINQIHSVEILPAK
uniref:Uncharacterized protein n=2 Tax=Brassica oleracea TaxID=3712 RepID=A0A0D3C499_BRAOL|nr:unnamed protein product [Brassica oleracea]